MRRLAILAFVLLAACKQDAAPPPPASYGPDTAAHFCQMAIGEMAGPKAQIALEGYPTPIFFGQVRDGIAYVDSPEKEARILAFYVSDMSKAPDWADPGATNWIAADKAYFVVGADVKGGMGAPEIVPFGVRQDAENFAASHGGRVMQLDDIPPSAVLAPVDKGSTQGKGT